MKCPCSQGIPPALVERLNELAKPIMVELGQKARDEGCIITSPAYDLIGHAMAIAAITIAHDILHRSEKLMLDPEVLLWLARQPPKP